MSRTFADRPPEAKPESRRALPARAVGAAALACAGCTIIVQGNPMPVPVPIPTPLVCADAATTPTAHVLFNVRVDRTTVNLAPHYARWMERTALALAAAEIVTTQAVLIEVEERPVPRRVLAAWGCNLDDPRALPPEDVLRHYATAADGGGDTTGGVLGCATDPLVRAGDALTEIVTQYPPELPGRSGVHVFGPAPTITLVVHVDARERRTGFDEPACDGARALLERDSSGRAKWLDYAGEGVPGDHVVHWFIATDELVSRDTFVSRCKEYGGLPTSVLDIIDASPKALYGPLTQELESAGTGRVASVPFCAMLEETESATFLTKEIHTIADLAGTEVDDDTLRSLLGGELPSGFVAGDLPELPDR